MVEHLDSHADLGLVLRTKFCASRLDGDKIESHDDVGKSRDAQHPTNANRLRKGQAGITEET